MKYRLILGLITLIMGTIHTGADVLAADNLKAITADDDGHLCFGTASGLTELVPSATDVVAATAATSAHERDFITYTTANGLPDNKVRDIAFDADGHAWIATYKSGVSVFNGQSWSYYTAGERFYDWQENHFVPTADGLADDDVQAILPLPDGRVWFGTAGGISLLVDHLWQHYTYAADGLASNAVEALAVDSAGNTWATHLAEGISRFDGQTWTIYTVDDGLADNWVHAVAVDGDGQLWFGTNGGVSKYDGQGWTTYTTADGLVDDTVFAVSVTPNGHKWFGTTGGVSEFDGQTWTTHLAGRAINDFAIAPNDDVWAVGGGQVSRLVLKEAKGLDGATWTDYLPDHFANQDLRAVAVDPAGRVWVGSFGAGVTVFNPDESPSSEQSWFGTSEGVSVFDKEGQKMKVFPISLLAGLFGLAGGAFVVWWIASGNGNGFWTPR